MIVDAAFEVVRASYDRLGTTYRDWSKDTTIRVAMLRRLLDRLGPGSLVIDLGCGPGEPVTRILATEHRVVAVDASRAQLGLARVAAPAAMLIEADMTRCAFRPGSVDAVTSFYATGHVPASRHAPLFSAISDWLRPGGRLLTSAPVAAGDTYDPDLLGAPVFFGGIGATATRTAIRRAGLVIELSESIREDEAAGRTVAFHWMMAETRRRATAVLDRGWVNARPAAAGSTGRSVAA